MALYIGQFQVYTGSKQQRSCPTPGPDHRAAAAGDGVNLFMVSDEKRELFERMPVPKAVASMAVPTIISQLISLIYSLVDTFFIGQTGNSYMVAAVTVSFTLFMMTIAFANLFGIGGGSLVARLMGVGKEQDARKVSAFSVWGALAIALCYSLLIALFLNPILRGLGASDSTIGFAKQYVWLVVILGSTPSILSTTCAHLLRNVGSARQASMGLSGGGILNIILDPLFMFVLLPDGWEIVGAALATLLSNVASCIYLLIVIARMSGSGILTLNPRELHGIRKEDIRGLFAVGVPSAILTGLFDVANIFLNALMAGHGDLPLAAVGIVMKAERLPNAVNIGLCQGMLPIVAYNYASGNRKRMNDVIHFVRVSGLLISVCSLALFEVFAGPVVHLFLNTSSGNPEDALKTLAFAGTFLRIRCLASPSQFLNYHSSYCLQAAGNGRDTLVHAIVREIVFYIPFMILFDRFLGMYALVAAVVAGETCGGLFALWLLHRWQRHQTVKES